MIKVSAETREMMVWMFNKFGDRPFTFENVSDTISPFLFEKFKLNRYIVKDDLYEIELKDTPDAREWWRINWSCVGNILKKKKRIYH